MQRGALHEEYTCSLLARNLSHNTVGILQGRITVYKVERTIRVRRRAGVDGKGWTFVEVEVAQQLRMGKVGMDGFAFEAREGADGAHLQLLLLRYSVMVSLLALPRGLGRAILIVHGLIRRGGETLPKVLRRSSA
jgi:hypothetical protein